MIYCSNLRFKPGLFSNTMQLRSRDNLMKGKPFGILCPIALLGLGTLKSTMYSDYLRGIARFHSFFLRIVWPS